MKNHILVFNAQPTNNTRLANLCGPLDKNLQQIAAAFDVQIKRRDDKFNLSGSKLDDVRQAQTLLAQFYDLSEKELSIDDIQLALVEYRANKQALPNQPDASLMNEVVAAIDEPVLRTKKTDLRGRTPMQRSYLQAILAHDISFGIGPAGTGKTYLAVACAVDALERETVKRIVLTRPAVEAGERLGFLPGDLTQKVDPYLRPLYDALYDLLGFEKVQKLFERNVIEIAPLAYMRGRTLNHAFIILDEAQNTTPEQMKMFLTRIGFGARAVITGDVTQIDLPRGHQSGLIQAAKILPEVRGISFTHFTSKDVVRHPLVARIVDAYDAFSSQAKTIEKHD